MKNLLIVESPTKARTISKYLGKDYEVVATVGHLRDLPKNKMAIDIKNNFEPEYVVDSEKKKIVDGLLSAAKRAERIILATDPDREGEAIAFHVKFLISNNQFPNKSQKTSSKKQISRITFHEITKEAVEEALKGAREVDMNMVNAQQGRRVLDRLVGYSLSPVLWRKVRRGLSAGRVQSVAVRLIAEREKEIESFTKSKFFRLKAVLGKKKFEAEMTRWKGERTEITTKIKLFDGIYSFSKSIFENKIKVEEIKEILARGKFEVTDVKMSETHRHPLPPLTTSKMQQVAARRFGWSGKQTMRIAQRLYEQGLITYHRTDAVNISEKAIEDFRRYIKERIGAEYVAEKERHFKNTSKNAQEAHEAIRPTSAFSDVEEIDSKEKKLYELIWKRAVATQASSAVLDTTKITLKNNEGEFNSGGVVVKFPGFLKITEDKTEEQELPKLAVGETLDGEVAVEELETSPPPRYSDASLVSSLEKQGIGRPSTYAPIISTILDRQYVEREEGRFRPTGLGTAVNEFLVANFAREVDLPFTAGMEEELDEVALGKVDWRKMIGNFWEKFEKEVVLASDQADRVRVAVEKTGEKCPECKVGDLVIRLGRFGKFISCDRFPGCKYTGKLVEKAGFNCPLCGGEGVVKKTRTGRKFYGCANYPNCKWAGWKKP
ncbi:MAG: type I DNA topoisomerase [Candidatus Shapirobacteria bacterium]|jgi:DNA topoisomerase-1